MLFEELTAEISNFERGRIFFWTDAYEAMYLEKLKNNLLNPPWAHVSADQIVAERARLQRVFANKNLHWDGIDKRER